MIHLYFYFFAEFDILLTERERQSILEYLPQGFSGANFEAVSKHLHKMKRPSILNARYFLPVEFRGKNKFKIVTKTTPGALHKKLGKDLVHSQIVPQKVSIEEIKNAIDKVYVRRNAMAAQDILIKCMSRF